MEGGLALMWFRVLVWVCGLALVFSQDLTIPTATIKILPEYTTVPREGDSVTLDCEISSLQPPDVAQWSRRSSLLSDTQQPIVDENGLNPALIDRRYSISPLQVVNSTAALYSHKITIYPVQQSDQGYYQCLAKRNSATIATSTEIHLLVHRLDVFPVCFPDGPATVTIGSSLLCKTLSDTRILAVSDTEMPDVITDGWVKSPTNAEGSPGQELNKTVTIAEHSKTFHCFSISSVSTLALACTIGPLTVVSVSTNPPSSQLATSNCPNCNTYIAILINSIVIHLITIILLFHCCRHWKQLRDMLSQSSTPRQENDRHDNNPELDYEVPSPEPRTAEPGTMSSSPETSEHVYHNKIAEPTSSSKQPDDSYMELNPPEQKPAVYSELKLSA
ncbi:uncharacterized protein [Asterias amurensis]|uniref:uncharacterized protein n=1 Tax=Asterias amurensis TaxID=7602 RepID=UPI003AB8FB19